MAEKIRIKDIAELSGVSVGTVDRILHNRPNVSKAAREKVEKVLKEINYQPNMYAAALAYNKSYDFTLLMPKHASEAYWEEIEEGAKKCVEVRRDFHIQAKVKYYKRFDTQSFVKASTDILEENPNGVIIVPSDLEVTQAFTDQLHQRDIPFILLDSYMPDLKPLSFFGQDSFQSGYFAAKMLMLVASKEKEIMLMKQMKNGKVASKQQDNREVGFRQYMAEHNPKIEIVDVNLYVYDKEGMREIMRDFFTKNPEIRHALCFNSSIHIIADFLRTEMPQHPHVTMLGYDAVDANVQCIKNGSADFLIAQHPQSQGLDCFRSMFNSCVLKMNIKRDHYMAIELLTKENIDFYKD